MSARTDTTTGSGERLEQRLLQSIDVLCEDAVRVELWATALGAFALPVPSYEPSDRCRLGGLQERPKLAPAQGLFSRPAEA